MIQLVLESKQTVDKAQHAGQTALTPKQIVTFEERCHPQLHFNGS